MQQQIPKTGHVTETREIFKKCQNKYINKSSTRAARIPAIPTGLLGIDPFWLVKYSSYVESGCVPRWAHRGILGAFLDADGETASQNIAIIAGVKEFRWSMFVCREKGKDFLVITTTIKTEMWWGLKKKKSKNENIRGEGGTPWSWYSSQKQDYIIQQNMKVTVEQLA